jgi:hypothetical protein
MNSVCLPCPPTPNPVLSTVLPASVQSMRGTYYRFLCLVLWKCTWWWRGFEPK